jgi:hypothetical protein
MPVCIIALHSRDFVVQKGAGPDKAFGEATECIDFGLSGVHALPLAAGRNEGGHYFKYISLFFLLEVLLFKTPNLCRYT